MMAVAGPEAARQAGGMFQRGQEAQALEGEAPDGSEAN